MSYCQLKNNLPGEHYEFSCRIEVVGMNIQRIKLTIFAKRFWPDEDSRPCRATIISHINRGWLSGKKIGTHWYIECTSWGTPLFYSSETEKIDLQSPPKTGNSIADRILAEI